MNKKLIFPIALVVATTVFISGCKKFVHQNIKAASNSSVAISTFNDVFEQLNAAVDSSLDAKSSLTWTMGGTANTTVMLSSLGSDFPKTLTIDYGLGKIGADGVSRSGKIIAMFDGNFEDENTVVNIWFDGYTNGQYSVAGTDSIINTGTNGDGKPTFAEYIRDVSIAWNSQEILWEADLNRTWTEGETTDFLTDTTVAGLNDDVFELTGTASGNDSNTHPFTLEINEAVVLKTECKWITGGMLIISPANFNEGTVDYGAGECDKQATIEVDGEVFNFTL